jgi:hypothetical protein
MKQIKYEFRGVIYTATPTRDDEIELRANGKFIGRARLKVQLEGTRLLGGDNESSNRIYAALEGAFARALAPPLSSTSNAHAAKCPWYITIAAVEQYCAIKLVSPEVDFHFSRAETELKTYAREIVAAGKEGKLMDSDMRQFRSPNSYRYRLLVSYASRAEGDLPQLIAVKPDHEGRIPKKNRPR